MSRAHEAAAALIVALTSSDDKKTRVAAALARKSVKALSDKTEKKMQAIWETSSADVVEFLEIVIENNPTKSIDEILKRADVQQALTKPYTAAVEASKVLVEDAWAASVRDAERKAKGEIALLKGKWKGYVQDDSIKDQLIGDLESNGAAMKKRLIAAMRVHKDAEKKPAKSAIRKADNDVALRARYTAQHAVKSAMQMVKESAFALAGLNREWVAAFGPNMCSHCRALHGFVVGPGEQFPKVNSALPRLKVYGGKLFGPPRHPNCLCMAVATKKPRTRA